MSNSAQTEEIQTLGSKDEDIGPTLSGKTLDMIAIDSLKWHYNEGKFKDMEPLQLEAFRIVLRYYGVSV